MNLIVSDLHGISIGAAPCRSVAKVRGGVGAVELRETCTSNGSQLTVEITDLPPEAEDTEPCGPNAALYPAQVRELYDHLGEWLEAGGWV